MKVSKKKKEARVKMMAGLKKQPICPNCLREGSHYIPPSFGDPGFYACLTKEHQ